MSLSHTVAVIDCGTNSTRLLIGRSEPGADNFETLDRLMRTTRLGAGVDAAGAISAEGLQRVADALEEYGTVMNQHDVEAFRVFATSAVRDARNRDEFVEMVQRVLGQPAEVIDGAEEGALSFAGATAGLDPADGPFLVCDIGGGSTELSWGGGEMRSTISLDVGSVRLTEKYLHRDPPHPEELVACLSVTELWFDDVARLHPEMSTIGTCIGVAGTFTTAAAVEIGLADYDREAIHHFRLTRPAAEDVFRTVATETTAERAENPGLPAARADIIVGGMCVLVKLMRYFDLNEVLISEADILDGALRQLLDHVAG